MGASIAQADHEVPGRTPAPAPKPGPVGLPAAVLALQRAAGNRATRRILARAMDPEDVEAFEQQEHVAVESYRLVRTIPIAARRIPPVAPGRGDPWGERRRLEAKAQKLRVKGGGIRKPRHAFKEKVRNEIAIRHAAQHVIVQAMPVAVGAIDPYDPAQARNRGVKAASLANQSTQWSTVAPELQAGIESPYNIGQRPNIPVLPQAIDSPVTTSSAAAGVGQITKVKRRAWTAGGTLTNANVRPPTWLAFKSLFHSTPHGGRGFIMGHLLNKHLGGFGHDMSNLAPFTYRLNRDHSRLVEQPIKDWLAGIQTPPQAWPGLPAAPPVPFGRWVDYKVTPLYMGGVGANPLSAPALPVPVLAAPLTNVFAHIQAWQTAWFAQHPQEAADLLEANNLIAAADNAIVRAAIANGTWRASTQVLAGGGTVQAVAGAVDAFFAWYLARHFPTHIVCHVRLYEHGLAGVMKSDTLEVTLPNDV